MSETHQDSGTGESTTSSLSSPKNTTSLTQSIEKLEGSMATGQSNYNAWRFRIIRILKEKDLLEAIESSTVSAAKDDQAFTIITLNIKDSQIPHIQDATTAMEAWTFLKEVHQGIGTNGRMVLMQRLWALKMSEGQDMAQHLNQFRELANQLRGLSQDGKGLDDSELLTILTLSLPDSYEPLVMALQSRTDIITFDVMAGRLLQESARRHVGQVTHKSHNNGSIPGTHTAFSANRIPIPRTAPVRTGLPNYGRGRGGFRGGYRGQYSGSSSGQTYRMNTGFGRGRGTAGTKCHYCGKEGHWKKDCYKRKTEESGNGTNGGAREFTFLARETVKRPQMGWVIDSGASQHLCGNRTHFSTYKTISAEHEITIADGSKIQAVGLGDIEIATEAGCITLTGVWHVPDIGGSLLSVSRIVDAGYTVEFGPVACYISKAGIQSRIGERYGRLYHLTQGLPTKPEEQTIEANLGLTTNQLGATTLGVWHQRLCHRSLDSTSVKYISSKVQDMEVTDSEKPCSAICGICAIGRQHKESQTKSREKADEILQVVHSDLCGPMQTVGIIGERYFITFVDETSGRISLSLLRTKDEALTAFQAYRARAEKSSGKEIKALWSDGGGEYLNKQFRKYLEDAGIQHQISPPYSPAQNGRAERANRTIMENARCILEDSKLGNEFWGQAVLTAAHVHNHIPSRSHNDMAPLEYWNGKPPGIGHLRIFGSTTWVHIPKEKRQKLDPKSIKCILIRYEENAGSKVYRVYDAEKKRIFSSRDVIIDESTVAMQSQTQSDTTVGWQNAATTPIRKDKEPSESDFRPLDSIIPEVSQIIPSSQIRDSITVRPAITSQNTAASSQLPKATQVAAEVPVPNQPRRSQRIPKPAAVRDLVANYALFAGAVEVEPETLTEALSGHAKEKWRAAWQSELTSLAANQTWVIEPLPADRKAIGCRWLFRKKDDGRYKARLVAKGYSQQPGIDYDETFAPLAKFTTIRILLALSCENDWEVEGMDVKTAFLNGTLDERIYMEVPEGIAIPVKKNANTYQPPMACRLIKAIYGLKQSPRAWYGRIHTFLQEHHFTRSDYDHSLFINYEKQVILLLYVDDLLLAAPTKELIGWIRNKLHDEFEMTDLGPLRNFLGLEIERNRGERTLHLSQSQYIQKILRIHGLERCNPSPTPADPHIRLERPSPEFEATAEARRQYQSAVGSLMYAMLGSRPDISYAVSKVSQYNSNPDSTHWTAVKRIFRYLAGTPNRGLCYGIHGQGAGFTDADWGSGEDRKSIGGYTFMLNGAAICWTSKKQTTVALSSTEAEYMALTQAVKESIWLQAVLQDLRAGKHRKEIKTINIDNQGAIALARNPQFHARTKHLDIQYHFVREHVEKQAIVLTYCPTGEMTADIFTKALAQPSFIKHNLNLGLIDYSAFILQGQTLPLENIQPWTKGSTPMIEAPARGGIVNRRRSRTSATRPLLSFRIC